MTKLKSFAWTVALACIVYGGLGVAGYPPGQLVEQAWESVGSLWQSKAAIAVVVRESSDPKALTTAQTARLMSPGQRKDAKSAGVQFLVCDPDETDKEGNTPADLVSAIERAKAKGLPRLILIGPRGGITDHPLPADESAARTRIGIGGTP